MFSGLVSEEGKLASGPEEPRGGVYSLEKLRHLVVHENSQRQKRFGRYVAPVSREFFYLEIKKDLGLKV